MNQQFLAFSKIQAHHKSLYAYFYRFLAKVEQAAAAVMRPVRRSAGSAALWLPREKGKTGPFD
jgi:hypothetical protein